MSSRGAASAFQSAWELRGRAIRSVDNGGLGQQLSPVSTGEEGSSTGPLARWVTRIPTALAQWLWIGPVLGAVVVAGMGVWVRDRVERAMKTELASQLRTVLNADVAALRLWYAEKQSDAKSIAADARIQQAVADLAALAKQPDATVSTLAQSAPATTIWIHLSPFVENQGYLDYVVVGKDRRILAAPHRGLVGRRAPESYDRFLTAALGGQVIVSRPFPGELPAREAKAGEGIVRPTMFVAAPMLATNGTVLAVIALRMQPQNEFSRMVSVGRIGETGEAYAFDRQGVVLTAGRFDRELRGLRLIPNRRGVTAILNLRLLDPGVDLRSLNRPWKPRGRLPLTRMAASATQGRAGFDVRGYRDFRGVPVVGAWTWLDDYDLGLATEVPIEEAFQPLYVLRRTFLVLIALLVLSSAITFAFSLSVERLQAAARQSVLRARRLGQYVLLQEIGRGANGMVYRARHALLRRPVAIKLLSPETTNEATAAGFEHEVQMTSQLTHPNTVAVYDYGRTPEGVFYYAMEYLSGIDLDRLVRQFGPQPEGRVIHLLRQVCGSLAEAHGNGLIHRDIKPANILLTCRGALCDVVKVLDFGLVKAMQNAPPNAAANAVVGTPRFMSPEAIRAPEDVDARSDIFSVGAVGYWLLTGQPLFDADQLDDLLARQAQADPPAPSARLGRPVSADLEALVLRCLAKSREDRPQSARELDEALAGCAAAGAWTVRDAELWWQVNRASVEAAPVSPMSEKTLVIERNSGDGAGSG